jgi:2-methylisocitrate lyase-like PEP mutase family enzyme
MTRAHLEQFRALHHQQPPSAAVLVLPNAWDALSARLVEQAGARAVATGSAALAWALGARDGEQLPLDTLIDVVREIAACVQVPLTVDLERGYSATPDGAADAVARVVDAGAVGVNLEDGGQSAELLADKIRAVRARSGSDVFINARTCVVLHGTVSGDNTVREVLGRAKLFAEAGADGLFVPRLADAAAIDAIVRGTALPLNLMLVPELAPVAELARLGVRRLTIGPRLAELAYAQARAAARALLETGSYEALLAPALLTYPEVNALFPAR